MPLVNCPDCKKNVSTDAISCPHCGKPGPFAESSTTTDMTPADSLKENVKKRPILKKVIFAAIVIVTGICFVYKDNIMYYKDNETNWQHHILYVCEQHLISFLKSPSSYTPIAKEMDIYSYGNKKGTPYVRIEYDAQNAMGVAIRSEKTWELAPPSADEIVDSKYDFLSMDDVVACNKAEDETSLAWNNCILFKFKEKHTGASPFDFYKFVKTPFDDELGDLSIDLLNLQVSQYRSKKGSAHRKSGPGILDRQTLDKIYPTYYY